MKKIKCRHCRKPKLSKDLLNGEYCAGCSRLLFRRISVSFPGMYEHLRGARRCAIPGCANHTDEGRFVGELCSPCHSYITLNKGTHSQAYRNEVFKAELRAIAKLLNDNPGVRLSVQGDRVGYHFR